MSGTLHEALSTCYFCRRYKIFTQTLLTATCDATMQKKLTVEFTYLGEFTTILRNTHVGYFYNKSWSTFQLQASIFICHLMTKESAPGCFLGHLNALF